MFMILQIFLATRAVLDIGEYSGSNVPQLSPGNIQSRDAPRQITRARKYLMDHKC